MSKVVSPPTRRKGCGGGVGAAPRRSPSIPAHRAARMRAGRALSASQDSDSDSEDDYSQARPASSAPVNVMGGVAEESDSDVDFPVAYRHSSVPLTGVGSTKADPPSASSRSSMACKTRPLNIYRDSDSDGEEIHDSIQPSKHVTTPEKSPSSEDRRRGGGDATPLTVRCFGAWARPRIVFVGANAAKCVRVNYIECILRI
jgi:hypothetical protein